MTDLVHSPLHERHVALGAKFGEFGGWEMPLEYAGGGVLAEHAAVREAVGVFDVSHLGTLLVQGPDAVERLNAVLTNDLHRIGAGRAQYTMLCNEGGGVVDDLIAYIRADDDVLLIPNAANSTEVARVLASQLGDDVTVRNVHRDYAIIAVQGPKSDEVLQALGLPTDMDYMAFSPATIEGSELTVCRTGYTGEKGYELVLPASAAPAVWDAVMAAGGQFGIRAAGLGARDTLRTEMGYALHGHEITPDINPVEAGTGWAVGWKKPDFDGAEALRAVKDAGPKRRATGLLATGRGIPRAGMTVVDDQGREVGVVTSGTFSPTLRQGIGLALVDADVLAAKPATLGVQVRNRVEVFTVTKPPFVTPGVRA